MNRKTLERWLDAYGQAWETRDPRAAADLFAEEATYRETPFDKPLKGREEISGYWSGVPRSQRDISFSYEILAVTEEEGIAHWSANYTRLPTNGPVELDGIFLVRLDASGRCTEFREWWHKQE